MAKAGLADVWPCFIVGKVGTDLHTTTFDPDVARDLTARVRPYGSYIKGHYTDGVSNPEQYPLCGMGAANVGPEFTMTNTTRWPNWRSRSRRWTAKAVWRSSRTSPTC